jgi:Protein of unknown function (DUF2380)
VPRECRAWCCVFAVAVVLALVPGAHAQTAAPFAVAAFDFKDTSGEPRDQTAEHAARVKIFDAALRDRLAADQRIRLVSLTCRTEPCSARNAGLEPLIDSAKAAEARYLLIGEFHKVSTLIGLLKLAVYDLREKKVACDRSFSYRGDTDEAFEHAARFAARDVGQNCIQ